MQVGEWDKMIQSYFIIGKSLKLYKIIYQLKLHKQT